MRIVWRARAPVIAALFFIATGFGAHAQDSSVIYRDVETKYVFGFTEGSGVGLEGEKEFSPETVARFGKRDGHYGAGETKLEYEFTPNQYVQFELGPMVAWHNISGVTDLDDRKQAAFSGFFGEIRYLLLDRGPSSPLAITLSAEPEWHRIDETSGARVKNFGLELKVNADLELIKNRLYLGSNLLYEPEATRDPDGVGAGWAQESSGGISGALSYRILPSVFVGAEVWYLRHYEGAWFNTYTGDAVFVGPTIYVQIAPKMFMTAAWNTQVAGHEVDGSSSLNLAEFSRQRAKLKVAVEF
ncbi:MAG TPA: hypothetical protein VII80_06735 [Pseudolabrys sp.]|jgi:hypothetical protein